MLSLATENTYRIVNSRRDSAFTVSPCTGPDTSSPNVLPASTCVARETRRDALRIEKQTKSSLDTRFPGPFVAGIPLFISMLSTCLLLRVYLHLNLQRVSGNAARNMPGKWCSIVGFLFTLLHVSYQLSEPGSSSYVAAVVEFTPTHVRNNGFFTLKNNTEAYVGYIKAAKEQDADIIVFPEYGLTSLYIPSTLASNSSWTTAVPSALERYVPCTGKRSDVSQTLKELSCAARDNKIYVVVNIAERESCDSIPERKCSANGTRHYNTNVVFDRTGKIIARYRKVNLYMEAQFDAPELPEVVTFDTDFGVKFGTFVCFDILFPMPALNLTRTERVTDIVFSTAWISETPFLTAVQAQYGWSAAEKVNFLGSGYHLPGHGSAGSGIYLGGKKKIAAATMSANPVNRLLISRVPKLTNPSGTDAKWEKEKEEVEEVEAEEVEAEEEEEEEEREWTDETTRQAKQENPSNDNGVSIKGGPDSSIHLMHDDLSKYKSIAASDSINETICDEGFCCHFQVRATSMDPTTIYRLVAFKGVRVYGIVSAAVRVCSLIQCSNDTIDSCGSVQPSTTTFSTLKITAIFDDYTSEFLVMPTLLNSSILPLDSWTFDDLTVGEQTSFTLALNKPTKDLATFGIYVRDFSKSTSNTGVILTRMIHSDDSCLSVFE